MLRHSHAEDLRKTTEFDYETFMRMKTFIIVSKTSHQKLISLMWVFIYIFDSDDYLHKYKTRLVIRNDLKEVSANDVYAAILIIKIFECLDALISTFDLKTKQFDVINALLNVKTNRIIHVYMSDDFAIDDKCLLLMRALYELRKSSLLWLRELFKTLVTLDLQQISEELFLFIDHYEIILFFSTSMISFLSSSATEYKMLIF